VSGFGREIRIVGTTEHAQVLLGGGDSMEGEVRVGRADCLCGEVVQYMCGSVEPFYLVASWNKSLKNREHGILLMVQRMRSALPFCEEV
jgi:hypothetical protein